MILLPNAIATETAKFDNAPVMKLGVKTFAAPTPDTKIIYGSLDWTRLWTGSYNGLGYWGTVQDDDGSFHNAWLYQEAETFPSLACITKAGTMILIDSNGTKHRYPLVGLTTDFSGWLGSDDPYFVAASYESMGNSDLLNNGTDLGGMDASKNATEIIQAQLTGDPFCTAKYRKSVDDGVNFGSNSPTYNDGLYTDLPTPDWPLGYEWANGRSTGVVKVAYSTDTEDVAILGTVVLALAGSFYIGLVMWTRKGGVWTASLPFLFPALSNPITGVGIMYRIAVDMAYVPCGSAGDWFICMSQKGTSTMYSNSKADTAWFVYGNGGTIGEGKWFSGIIRDSRGVITGIRISDAYEEIGTFADMTTFEQGGLGLGQGQFLLQALEQNTLTTSLGGWEGKGGGGGGPDPGVQGNGPFGPGWGPSTGAPWDERIGGEEGKNTDFWDSNMPDFNQRSKFDNPNADLYRYTGDKSQESYHANLRNNRLYQGLIRQGGGVVGQRVHQNQQNFANDRGMFGKGFPVQPYCCFIPDYGLIYSAVNNSKLMFYVMRDDMTVKEAVFYKSFSMNAPYPGKLMYTDDYLFLVSGSYVYIAPRPEYWTTPTAGAGLGGSELEIPNSRILSFDAVEGMEQPGRLDVTIDNSDGAYDTIGSGANANIKRGSQVDLYLGYYDTSEHYNSYRKFFIETAGYGRSDNRGTFILHCVDGWKMLDDYIFTREIHWNQFDITNPMYLDAETLGDVPRYTLYQLIEKCLTAIGFTLTYHDRSYDIWNMYPKVSVKCGTSAGAVVRKLLSQVRDELIFNGTVGTIIYPFKTDERVLYMKFPKYV